MAYIGLANPVIAKLDESGAEPKYSEGAECGKAIGIDISPQYAEGSLYANDIQSEYDKEFKYADMTLNTDTIPIKMNETMFGHTVTEDGAEFSASDENTYVGVGIRVAEKINGVRKYTAIWIYKAKFSEPSESYKTKGENIEYQTPSITGRAIPMKSGLWKTVKVFDTEDDALAWLNEKAGIITADETL